MASKKMKSSLAWRRHKNQIKKENKIIALANEPLFSVKIGITGGGITYTAGALALLANSIGDEKACEWHSKYLQKFDELVNECTSELDKIASTILEERKTEK